MCTGSHVYSFQAAGSSRCSSAEQNGPTTEQQNMAHRNTTLKSLSQDAQENESKDLYKYSRDADWPGTDGVMLSYYQYELGKLDERIEMNV